MADLYKDPIMQKYIDLITDIMPGMFKGIYFGDPVRIPASNFPALIIYKNSTAIKAFTNAEDLHQISMTLNIATYVSQEINDDKTIKAGVAMLYDLIEGRDSSYKLKPNSILNILRSNQLVDEPNNLITDLANITRIDYGMTFGKREKEAYSVEGMIEFTANFTQLRN
jgi:hypothetical protein